MTEFPGQIPLAEEAGAPARRSNLRRIGLAALAAGLAWLATTTTLPYALAPRWPEAALALNPRNPVALMELAEERRTALLAKAAPSEEQEAASANAARFSAPELLPVNPELLARPADALRSEIADLARRTIAADPLNAKAFRLLGELADNRDSAREYMLAAVARSRRESAAVFWLMDDAYQRAKPDDVLRYADILLRSRGQLSTYVFTYLGQLTEAVETRAKLVALLKSSPPWRERFLSALPRVARRASDVGALFAALRSAEGKLVDRELNTFLGFLVRQGEIDQAYAAWIANLPPEDLATLGFVNNAGFETEATGAPFDWQLGRSINATVEIGPVDAAQEGASALSIAFGVGRIEMGRVSQLLVLGAGRYRLSGWYRGSVIAKRGLVWSIACRNGRKPLAATEPIAGRAPEWRQFELTFEVPEGASCLAQTVMLYHAARSSSEKFISGEIQFDSLKVEKRAEGTADTETSEPSATAVRE